jgi:hypothetical protein
VARAIELYRADEGQILARPSRSLKPANLEEVHMADKELNIGRETAPPTPPSNSPNGVDPVPLTKRARSRKAREPLGPPVDDFTGEAPSAAGAEQSIPLHAEPPPPASGGSQKVNMKLDLEMLRKTRVNVMAVSAEAFRIPVLGTLDSSKFVRMHPTYGGVDDPMPIWRRESTGKGGSSLHLVAPGTVGKILAHGGKVAMCAVYWGQYSVGGQFLTVVNVESDNVWVLAKRKIYEAMRSRWLRLVNAGNTWDGQKPPSGAEIPDCGWASLTWDEVLNLGFDEVLGDEHPLVVSLVYGGHPPVIIR